MGSPRFFCAFRAPGVVARQRVGLTVFWTPARKRLEQCARHASVATSRTGCGSTCRAGTGSKAAVRVGEEGMERMFGMSSIALVIVSKNRRQSHG